MNILKFAIGTITSILIIPIKILLMFISAIVVSVALLFTDKAKKKLPVYWFANDDDPINDLPMWWVKRFDADNWYWRSWLWLVWRNPISNFSKRVIGFTNRDVTRVNFDWTWGQNPSDWAGRSGLRLILVEADHFPYWAVCYQLVYVWPFNKGRCLEWGWGWKAWRYDNPDIRLISNFHRLPHPWRATSSPGDRA